MKQKKNKKGLSILLKKSIHVPRFINFVVKTKNLLCILFWKVKSYWNI